MKTSKNLFLSIMLILFSAFSFAQEPSALIISNTQDIHNANELYADFNGEVTATTWDKDYVLIEMKIEAKNVSLGVAKYLVNQERFCLKVKKLGDRSIVFFMPNCKHKVLINGQKLSEDISYQIFVPKGVTLRAASVGSIIPCPSERKSLAKEHIEIEENNTTAEKEQNSSSF